MSIVPMIVRQFIRQLFPQPAPQHVQEPAEGWEAYFASRRPPSHIDDSAGWDQFWCITLEDVGQPKGLTNYFEVVHPLVPWMRATHATTVVSVACGISLEVQAFAAAGFHAVGFDRSVIAAEYAQECPFTVEQRQAFLDDRDVRPGGSARFEVGDLREPTVCTGPYDVVVCRKTMQYFAQAGQIDEAMSALVARLRSTGVLVLTTHFGIIDLKAVEAIESWLTNHQYRLIRGDSPPPEQFYPRSDGERRVWHTVSTG